MNLIKNEEQLNSIREGNKLGQAKVIGLNQPTFPTIELKSVEKLYKVSAVTLNSVTLKRIANNEGGDFFQATMENIFPTDLIVPKNQLISQNWYLDTTQ